MLAIPCKPKPGKTFKDMNSMPLPACKHMIVCICVIYIHIIYKSVHMYIDIHIRFAQYLVLKSIETSLMHGFLLT